MAKAKKLPSGNWNIKVFSHIDPNTGKRIYQSFTESTKQLVEMKAAKFANNKGRSACSSITLEDCIEEYITAKETTLSPGTIRSYRAIQKKYFEELKKKDINKITNYDVQLMLNNLKDRIETDRSGKEYHLSAKTIKNIYTLFTAAIRFKSKDIEFNVQLPQDDNPEEIEISDLEDKKLPSNEEVKLLFRAASPWMQKCIALAAFSSMRRGEIAALKYKDILADECKIFVHAAFVMDENNNWIYKIPKTKGSIRLVNAPKEVIELLGTGDPEEYIIGYNPNTISKMFIKLRDNMGIDVRFHDLRHYFASIGNILHIPDTVLADFGGWEHNSPVMKKVYQGNIKDISDGYARKMNKYFSDILNNDILNENKDKKKKEG